MEGMHIAGPQLVLVCVCVNFLLVIKCQESTQFIQAVEFLSSLLGLHLIVVRRFEYADDPKSYTSGSVVTGRASHGGKVKG